MPTKPFVRIDSETKRELDKIKEKVKQDIKAWTGREQDISYGKVIKMAFPPYNDNFIEASRDRIIKLFVKRRLKKR